MIQPFNPAVLHTQGQPITGGDIASSFQNSYYGARQDLRAQQSSQNETDRLGMQKDQFAQQSEDRAYNNEFIRPLQEQAARVGILGQTLDIKSREQQLQIGALGIADQLQRKQMLQNIMGDMASYTQQQSQGGSSLGKVTSYGYKADPTGDSASLGTGKYTKPTGAWDNELSGTSLAVSPDIEQQFNKSGIKRGDPVELTLANGKTVTRTWDDRTMQDAQAMADPAIGKPLRGRFDFYNQDGTHPLDGSAVTSFKRAGQAPAYVAAAGAQNPQAVATAAVGGEAAKFLGHYDQLKLLADTDPNSANGLQARMLMQSMERDPQFQQAFGQRENTMAAARNQAAITQSVMGAPAAFVGAFNTRFPQFSIQAVPGGQLVPVSTITGNPLTLQEQGAFASAWDTHTRTYKPDDDGKLGDTVAKEYAKYKSVYEAGKDISATEKDEKLALQRRQANGALAAMRTLELTEPKLAAARATEEAKAAAAKAVTGPAGSDIATPAVAGTKSLNSLLPKKVDASQDENNQTWNKVKEEVGKRIDINHPDNGKDSSENPALVLAARIKKGDQEAVSEAMKLIKGTGDRDRSGVLGSYKTSIGIRNTIGPVEGVRAWADGLLNKYGYLDDQGKEPRQAQQPRGAASSNIKSITEIK